MVQRYHQVIRVKPEKLEEYIDLHRRVWPLVLDKIKKCNMRNYSIAVGKIDQDEILLYGYFEYIGSNFEEDMKKMREDSVTRSWWLLTTPCQEALEYRLDGEWWMNMEEVFYTP